MNKPSIENPYNKSYDLTNCDEEPIHQIQTVQSFACILAVHPDNLVIQQASENTVDFLNLNPNAILDQSLENFFSSEIIQQLKEGISQDSFVDINPIIIPLTGMSKIPKIMIAHLSENRLILEIEINSSKGNNFSFLNKLDAAIQKVQSCSFSKELFQVAAKEVKAVTGYDRVMIYQFTKEYDGVVIAEEKEDHLEPYFGLRYPATDIPKQARELFLRNRVRMLIDIDDELSMITPSLDPQTKQALNVGNSACRGVSPIHLEYLRNMEVNATLNVAIVENEKLWGLIACHHGEKKVLNYQIRSLVKLIGQVISGHLSLFRAKEFRDKIIQIQLIHSVLFEQMNEKRDILLGLTTAKYSLLDLVEADGAAIVLEKGITKIGNCPSENEITEIITNLNQSAQNNIFRTDSMKKTFGASFSPQSKFAGLLSIKLSEEPGEYLMWFRLQQDEEVVWGGNPEKAMHKTQSNVRISPRKSFEKWKQIVKDKSSNWQKHEVDAALNLRNSIKDILLLRFSELKTLHNDLQRSYQELDSFSYTVSHDLRSPLRGIEGFAQILLEDYADKLDSYGIDVINTIIESTEKMNQFINDILNLSKLAKQKIDPTRINIQDLIQDIIENIETKGPKGKNVQITVAPELPPLYGNQTMIKQLFYNLISNSVKYSRPKEDAKILISGWIENKTTIYKIEDNGIGFEMKYANKIFEVFSRLVSEDDYKGSGVGLAIVKRVVERHKGKIDVQSERGIGTSFTINFPPMNNL